MEAPQHLDPGFHFAHAARVSQAAALRRVAVLLFVIGVREAQAVAHDRGAVVGLERVQSEPSPLAKCDENCRAGSNVSSGTRAAQTTLCRQSSLRSSMQPAVWTGWGMVRREVDILHYM